MERDGRLVGRLSSPRFSLTAHQAAWCAVVVKEVVRHCLDPAANTDTFSMTQAQAAMTAQVETGPPDAARAWEAAHKSFLFPAG